MWKMIWAGWKYRWICARNKQTDMHAYHMTKSIDLWIDGGAPGKRMVWASAWIIHFLLWPVRKWNSKTL